MKSSCAENLKTQREINLKNIVVFLTVMQLSNECSSCENLEIKSEECIARYVLVKVVYSSQDFSSACAPIAASLGYGNLRVSQQVSLEVTSYELSLPY